MRLPTRRDGVPVPMCVRARVEPPPEATEARRPVASTTEPIHVKALVDSARLLVQQRRREKAEIENRDLRERMFRIMPEVPPPPLGPPPFGSGAFRLPRQPSSARMRRHSHPSTRLLPVSELVPIPNGLIGAERRGSLPPPPPGAAREEELFLSPRGWRRLRRATI